VSNSLKYIKSELQIPIAGVFLLGTMLFPLSTNAQTPAFSVNQASTKTTDQIAQVTAPPQFVPTDVTPFTTATERNEYTPGYKFRIFQALPSRLWFNATTEMSQRIDTNVFFTYSHPKFDTAFRILPNITAGYNVLKNTSIYTNYFVIKDVFADHTSLNFPTTQSLSMGIRHNQQLGQKTNLQFDFQARELWQTSHLRQFDFLPSLTLTRVINPNNIAFGSTLLQLRGGDYFVAPTREIDPFYTLGYLYRKGLWNFVITDTLVTNFRHPPFNDSIPRQSNVTMITDIEINRPIFKRFPALVGFVRAEPIWNWKSAKAPGLSGFDFRFFVGMRLNLNKPAYNASMDNLRKQIIDSENNQAVPPALPPKSFLPNNSSVKKAKVKSKDNIVKTDIAESENTNSTSNQIPLRGL
jgi:hypothetical protein